MRARLRGPAATWSQAWELARYTRGRIQNGPGYQAEPRPLPAGTRESSLPGRQSAGAWAVLRAGYPGPLPAAGRDTCGPGWCLRAAGGSVPAGRPGGGASRPQFESSSESSSKSASESCIPTWLAACPPGFKVSARPPSPTAPVDAPGPGPGPEPVAPRPARAGLTASRGARRGAASGRGEARRRRVDSDRSRA